MKFLTSVSTWRWSARLACAFVATTSAKETFERMARANTGMIASTVRNCVLNFLG